MPIRFRVRLFIALVISCAIAAVAQATTIIPADFNEMIAGSQSIVHGSIVDVRSQMTGARRTIETVVTVAVIDTMKGPSATRVLFRIPAGQVGRYRRVMVGAPEFVEGDEVVLFLSGRAPAMPMPFGLNQGVYRVSHRDGSTFVTPLVPAQAGRVVRGDPARRPVTVDEFARQVRAVATR